MFVTVYFYAYRRHLFWACDNVKSQRTKMCRTM